MEMLGKVRRMHYRDGLSCSEIARRTGLSRTTVKKWLGEAKAAEPRYRRSKAPGKLTAFEVTVVGWLEADARRPKRERRTAQAMFTQLKAQGFEGSYTLLTDFIRAWRRRNGTNDPGRAFVPLKLELGEAFQFDWSEERLVIGGVWRKLQVAHLKLCASHAFVLVAYPSQAHEMLFDAHTRSFEALGGIARCGIYDNMKTAVDKVKKGRGPVCKPGRGARSEGIVEKNVQDSRRRIWQQAGEERFGSMAELNAWLLARCRSLWQGLRHPQYALTIAEMLEHEQAHLMPMIAPFDGYVEAPGRVSSTCLVTANRNHYSVPCEWAGKLISKRFYPERIEFVFDEAVVASHPSLFDRE